MEFDKPSTKYAFFTVIGSIVLAMVFCSYELHQESLQRDEQHRLEREACKTLNASYGESFSVKEGFYSGNELIAVGQSDESLTLIFLFQPENPMRFRCSDLRRTP